MSAIRYIVLLFAFTVIQSAVAADRIEQTVNLSLPTYLALGDSYTTGDGVKPSDSFPLQLVVALHRKGLPIDKPVLIARPGWTTKDLASAMESRRITVPFDLVTLLIGTNDRYNGYTVYGYRRRFLEVLAKAITFTGGNPKRVIVLSIPDWGATPSAQNLDRYEITRIIDRLNEIAMKETQLHGARFINITTISQKARRDSSLIAPDGFHPSGKMYRLWVDKVLPTALEALGQ